MLGLPFADRYQVEGLQIRSAASSAALGAATSTRAPLHEFYFNLLEGVGGELGEEESRPDLDDAPALLGLDDTIFAFCSALLNEQTWYDGAPNGFNPELAYRCTQANRNVLRLLSMRKPWNMCQK